MKESISMDKISILEWNIHGMTGTGVGGNKYSFPAKLIVDSISKVGSPNIIVLTEFVSKLFSDQNPDSVKLKSGLVELGYSKFFVTKSYKGRNGICIATKDESFNYICEGGEGLESPDLLVIGNDNIVIFGIRLTSGGTNKQVEYFLEKVKEQQDAENNVIMIGDFNKSYEELIGNRIIKAYNKTDKKIIVHKHEDIILQENDSLIKENMYSSLDHVLTTFDTNVAITYKWDYMKAIYDFLDNKATYINRRCLPDHAMLCADIEPKLNSTYLMIGKKEA